jgi:hypothetical protein
VSEIKAWIIPWYREQDWTDWVTVCKFDGSHKDWLTKAETGTKTQESLGYNVAKVVIEPSKFIEWSRINGGKIDHEARMKYATSVFHSRGSSGN